MTKRTRLESLLPGISARIDAQAAILAEADALIRAGMTKSQALILFRRLRQEVGGNGPRATR